MIEAIGILAEPLARLGDAIAESASFQEWSGAADADAAQAFIHLYQTGRDPALPLCLIDWNDGFVRNRLSLTNRMPFEQQGEALIYLRDQVDSELDERDATVLFANRVGAVWSDLERSAALPGRLPINTITLAAPPARSPSDRRAHTGDIFEVAIGVAWTPTR